LIDGPDDLTRLPLDRFGAMMIKKALSLQIPRERDDQKDIFPADPAGA